MANVNYWVDLNSHDAGRPQHAVSLPTHKEVDSVASRVGMEDFEQPIPRRRRRIAQAPMPVGLVACHCASGARQSGHLVDHMLGLGHIHQDKPCVNQIERGSWQTGCFGVALVHFHVRKAAIGGEFPRQLNGRLAPFEPNCFPVRPDAFGK